MNTKPESNKPPLDSFAPDPDKLLLYGLNERKKEPYNLGTKLKAVAWIPEEPYTAKELNSTPYQQRDAEPRDLKRWWKRIGDGDWQWSERSYQDNEERFPRHRAGIKQGGSL